MAYSPSEKWENGVLVERNRSTWDAYVRDPDSEDDGSFRDDVEGKPVARKRVSKKSRAAKK